MSSPSQGYPYLAFNNGIQIFATNLATINFNNLINLFLKACFHLSSHIVSECRKAELIGRPVVLTETRTVCIHVYRLPKYSTFPNAPQYMDVTNHSSPPPPYEP